MNFSMSDRAVQLRDAVHTFVETKIIPRESEFVAEIGDGDRWQALPSIEASIDVLKFHFLGTLEYRE